MSDINYSNINSTNSLLSNNLIINPKQSFNDMLPSMLTSKTDTEKALKIGNSVEDMIINSNSSGDYSTISKKAVELSIIDGTSTKTNTSTNNIYNVSSSTILGMYNINNLKTAINGFL